IQNPPQEVGTLQRERRLPADDALGSPAFPKHRRPNGCQESRFLIPTPIVPASLIKIFLPGFAELQHLLRLEEFVMHGAPNRCAISSDLIEFADRRQDAITSLLFVSSPFGDSRQQISFVMGRHPADE